MARNKNANTPKVLSFAKLSSLLEDGEVTLKGGLKLRLPNVQSSDVENIKVIRQWAENAVDDLDDSEEIDDLDDDLDDEDEDFEDDDDDFEDEDFEDDDLEYEDEEDD